MVPRQCSVAARTEDSVIFPANQYVRCVLCTAVPWEDSYSPLTAMGFRRPLTSSVLKNELDVDLIRNVQQQCDEAYV